MQGMGGGCEASNTITESETLSSHNNMEEKQIQDISSVSLFGGSSLLVPIPYGMKFGYTPQNDQRRMGASDTQRYFQDPAFINYLKYLSYWKQPEYAKFIVYPHCLYFLDLLQDENFVQELNNPVYVENIWKQQFYHWRYYKQNKVQVNGIPPQQT